MLANQLVISETDTYREILQQPEVWLKEYSNLLQNKKEIESFVSKHFDSKNVEIILSGAGTSAYIGNILSVIYARKGYSNCRAVSTTDIITHPENYLPTNKKVILISFARSGNSPESIATIELADKICKEVAHIIITCNEEGILAKSVTSNDLLLLLPPETDDKSLAMTSSFSTMLLTGMLLPDISIIEDKQDEVKNLSENARHLLETYLDSLEKIAERSFSRAIFLGSGERKGIAEECHLKLQEMTDGKVICKFESFLGFRHGPKAAINEDTLLIYFFSNDEYVFAYEKDLVNQINTNNQVVGQIAVSENKINIPSVRFDLEINTHILKNDKKNEYNFIIDVLAGQILAFFKSVNLNFNPDSPSVSGNIARIVTGVNIYNYNK